MKKTHLEQMQEQMTARFGPESGKRIGIFMKNEYDKLCKEYENRPKALTSHTHNNIFPVAVTFRALLAEGMDRKEAAQISTEAFLVLMEEPANALRKLLKIPGLYRLMPWIWKTAMPKLFGEDAGFRFHFYPSDNKQVKFDMLECPYFCICKELDCIEIAPVFCTTDDVCYGHMHKKLIWNRTKTIARGADVCDFDLYIPK